MSDNRIVVTITNSSGTPLTGLSPSWRFCTNVDTSTPVTPRPVVTELGNGIYLIERKAGGHIVGQLDFGITAIPQFVTYDVTQPAATVRFTSVGAVENPTITAVKAPRVNQVQVTFSTAVKMTTDLAGALCLGNYEIPGLTVTVVRQVDDRQVLLTTATQTPATTYDLVVYNVQDLFGNSISPL